MEKHLKKKKVWSTIEGGSRPVAAAAAAAAAVIAERNAAIKEWDEKCDEAIDLIVQACDTSQLVYIRHATTPLEMWNALKAQHRRSTVGSKVRLMSRLNSMKMDVGDSAQKHIDEMSVILDQLEQQGAPVEDSTAIGIILSSLSEDFDSLVTAIEAWDDDRLTLVNVRTKIIDEALRREENTSGAARYNAGRRFGGGAGQQKRRGDGAQFKRAEVYTCYNCGLPGHIKRFCPTNANKDKPDLRIALNNVKNESNKEEPKAKSARTSRLEQW